MSERNFFAELKRRSVYKAPSRMRGRLAGHAKGIMTNRNFLAELKAPRKEVVALGPEFRLRR